MYHQSAGVVLLSGCLQQQPRPLGAFESFLFIAIFFTWSHTLIIFHWDVLLARYANTSLMVAMLSGKHSLDPQAEAEIPAVG